MTDDEDDKDILDQIADEVGAITDEQEEDVGRSAASDNEDEFDPTDYRRNMDEYDGDW